MNKLVDTKSDPYLVAAVFFVTYSAFLYVFNVLPAWDPAFLALPEWQAYGIYLIAAISGTISIIGIIVAWLSFRVRRLSHLLKQSLWAQLIGIAVQAGASFSLFIATASKGRDGLWIAGMALAVALAHFMRVKQLSNELNLLPAKIELEKELGIDVE
jgi:hypothetical protein